MLTKIIIIGSSSEEEKETSLFISLARKSVNIVAILINEESLADFLVYMKCGNRWELDRGDVLHKVNLSC